jgi:hypothetical protein
VEEKSAVPQKAERLELVVSLKGGQKSFENEVVNEQPVGHGLGLLRADIHPDVKTQTPNTATVS